MFSLKTLLPPSKLLINPFHNVHSLEILKYWLISLQTRRPISALAQLETPIIPKSPEQNPNRKFKGRNKRPLDVLFKEAVGLCERREINESEIEVNGGDNARLRKKLWELEMELRQLKAESEEGGESKPKRGLVALFAIENTKTPTLGSALEGYGIGVEKGERVALKEISVDMQVLLKHLYDRGYFKGANFLQNSKFDISYFESTYARDFLKSAVEKFGKDHQEISKWLAGSDLKTISLFGCPSKKKREVFAAKRLRSFLEIPEDTVCSKCSLKESCKFACQSVWGDGTKNLRLDLLMRLLGTYSLEDIPPEIKLTDNVKACVSRLIHEIINLTKSSM